MKRSHSYRIKLESIESGQIVFAKIKGYPPWPAKILSVVDSKYEIKYFGPKAETYVT